MSRVLRGQLAGRCSHLILIVRNHLDACVQIYSKHQCLTLLAYMNSRQSSSPRLKQLMQQSSESSVSTSFDHTQLKPRTT